MKRFLLNTLACLALFSIQPAVMAQAFEKNVNYHSIWPEPPVGQAGDKIEIVEFFMYSCPHCYRFEPIVKAWLKTKADDIDFVHIPAMFGGSANLYAKAYYALEAMGEIKRLHEAFFTEIHVNNNKLRTREAVEAFLQKQGVDLEKFREAMRSFAVVTKTNRAKSLLRRYNIDGVPSLVVDGRYKSGSGLTLEKLMELADHLAEKVRQERQNQAK